MPKASQPSASAASEKSDLDHPKYIEWTETDFHGVRVSVNDTVLKSLRKAEKNGAVHTVCEA